MSRPKFQFRIGDFEFNLRELAGSMGDFGTLFPLAIGYFAVNGLNPAGLLVMMELAIEFYHFLDSLTFSFNSWMHTTHRSLLD